MAYFHLDHNVAVRVAPLLQTYGHTAVSARDLGLGPAGDHEHLLIAAEAQRIFVTHNWKDFRLLHNAWRYWSQAWFAIHPLVLYNDGAECKGKQLGDAKLLSFAFSGVLRAADQRIC